MSAQLGLIRRYYDGCSTGDAPAMLATLHPEVVHYFLAPNPGSRAVRGAEALVEHWRTVQARYDARWVVDAIVGDGDTAAGEAVIEWSMFWTPAPGGARVAIRGAEGYRFAGGLIAEIRAFYRQDPERSTELRDFDYAGRGYSHLGREASDLHPAGAPA
jgi:ketosteroid isomerase-like protein